MARIERRFASLGWAVKTSSTDRLSSACCTASAEKPACFQFGDRRRQRFGNGFRIEPGLALPQHPHPLPVFGDVGQVEKDAERPGDGARLVVVEGGDFFGQLLFGLARAAAPFAGQQPDFLDQFQGGRAGQLRNDRPQHVGQHPHVATQQIVTHTLPIDHGKQIETAGHAPRARSRGWPI